MSLQYVLAFMSAVDEKADMERTARGAAAYKVIEDIRDSQLGGLKKELNKLQQQTVFFANVSTASKYFGQDATGTVEVAFIRSFWSFLLPKHGCTIAL